VEISAELNPVPELLYACSLCHRSAVAEKLYQVPTCSGKQEMMRVEKGARVVLNEFLEGGQVLNVIEGWKVEIKDQEPGSWSEINDQ